MAEDLLSYLVGYTPKWVKPESDREMLERIYASLGPVKKDEEDEDEEGAESFEDFIKRIQRGTAHITSSSRFDLSNGEAGEETRDMPDISKIMKQRSKTKTPEEKTKMAREDFAEMLGNYLDNLVVEDDETDIKELLTQAAEGEKPRIGDALAIGRPKSKAMPTDKQLISLSQSAIDHASEAFNTLKAFANGEKTVGELKDVMELAQIAVEELSDEISKLRGPLEEEARRVDPQLANRLKRWVRIAIYGAKAVPGKSTEMSSFPALINAVKSGVRDYIEDPEPRKALHLWDASGQLASQLEQISKLVDELATISPKARLNKPLDIKRAKEVRINMIDKIWREIKPGDDPDAVDIEVVKNILKRYKEARKPLRPKALAIDLKVDEPVAIQFIQRLMQSATPMESIRRNLFLQIDPIKTRKDFAEVIEHYDHNLASDTIIATEALHKLFGLAELCRQQLLVTQ